MTARPAHFELGEELSPDGRFVRQESAYRRLITADCSSGFPAEPGRYHLYAALACPWSQRSLIVRILKGLEDAITVSYAHPYRDSRGWAFPGGEFVDRANGFEFLAEAYIATDPDFDDRVTVPVIWDTETREIVSNESGDIMRMLGTAFDAFGNDLDLYPEPLRGEIDSLELLLYENLNNAVYVAGFSTDQRTYEDAFGRVFATFDYLEERLGSSRYLCGDRLTEPDFRLFPTLLRFDTVYYQHFKCNRRRIVDYANLWAYTRDIYQHPRVAETVAIDQIKEHYFTTHDMINPSRIVPAGPELDFLAPHGRG